MITFFFSSMTLCMNAVISSKPKEVYGQKTFLSWKKFNAASQVMKEDSEYFHKSSYQS